MNYTSDNLYLVSFKDDTANFYVEQNFSLIPLFETKRIQDTNKIINCVGFQNNQIDFVRRTQRIKWWKKKKI